MSRVVVNNIPYFLEYKSNRKYRSETFFEENEFWEIKDTVVFKRFLLNIKSQSDTLSINIYWFKVKGVSNL